MKHKKYQRGWSYFNDENLSKEKCDGYLLGMIVFLIVATITYLIIN